MCLRSIQDTTELNYARHAGRVRELGASDNGVDPGLFVHPALVIDAASKALLGLTGMQIWTRRAPASPDDRCEPIEAKESYRWIQGARSAKSALAAAAMVTVIGERESDIYEEFDRIPDAHPICSRVRPMAAGCSALPRPGRPGITPNWRFERSPGVRRVRPR